MQLRKMKRRLLRRSHPIHPSWLDVVLMFSPVRRFDALLNARLAELTKEQS